MPGVTSEMHHRAPWAHSRLQPLPPPPLPERRHYTLIERGNGYANIFISVTLWFY